MGGTTSTATAIRSDAASVVSGGLPSRFVMPSIARATTSSLSASLPCGSMIHGSALLMQLAPQLAATAGGTGSTASVSRQSGFDVIEG